MIGVKKAVDKLEASLKEEQLKIENHEKRLNKNDEDHKTFERKLKFLDNEIIKTNKILSETDKSNSEVLNNLKTTINEIKESNASDLKKINDLTTALSSLQDEIQASSDLCLERSETQKANEALQSKEFDEKLEKWLETQKSNIISLETSQKSGLEELKKSQDTE